MDRIKYLIRRNWSIILYLFFGGLTTLVNILTYFLCYHPFGLSNLTSTAIAWAVSVLFAFLTNKVWVFDSKSFSWKVVLYEGLTFFSCRIATGLLDMGFMYVSVDCLHWNDLICKIVSNLVVIVLNYIASKVLIFKKDGNR